MKRNILFALFTLFSLVAVAQVKQEVIASAGGYNKSADNAISISWTLGETIVPTFTSQDGSLILTHGFQQKLIVTAIEENIEEPVKVTVFPNPVSEQVFIRFESVTDKEILLYLLDAQGRAVKTDKIEAASIEKAVIMQDLPAGIYYLRLVKGKLVNVYKVVKL